MKQDQLSRCIGNVDHNFVEEAESHRTHRKNTWIKWGSMAACLCLLAVGVFHLVNQNNGPISPNNQTDPSKPVNGTTLYIPAIELPEPVSQEGVAVEMDMVGLVVYKGRIYTQAQDFYDKDDVAIALALLDEHIGTAKGNIDEWSKQDDYATELASTYNGDVYTVKGYDPKFRLAIKWSFEEDGATIINIGFFENLNDIHLEKGSAIFSDRLQLLENWDYVKTQEHNNWNNEWPDYVYHDLNGISENDIEAFISALNDGEFLNIDLSDQAKYDPKADEVSASTTGPAHLYFYLKDGTRVELMLLAGGYVAYRPLSGSNYVKMPGDAFDKIFEACK